MRPPTNLDTSERKLYGLTYRQVAILATAGLVALGCLVGLKTWALWVRIGLVLACAGIAMFWAFWQNRGQTLEGQLLVILTFYRSTRTLVHRALREIYQGKVDWQPSEPAKEAASKPTGRTVALDWAPGFLWITANALGISILTALTFWLLQGGAHQLEQIWNRL